MNRRDCGFSDRALRRAGALRRRRRHCRAPKTRGRAASFAARPRCLPRCRSTTRSKTAALIARFTGGRTPLVASNFSGSRRASRWKPAPAAELSHQGLRRGERASALHGEDRARRAEPRVDRHAATSDVVGASAGRLKVKRSARAPLKGNFTGSAACSAFTLHPRRCAGMERARPRARLRRQAELGRAVRCAGRRRDPDAGAVVRRRRDSALQQRTARRLGPRRVPRRHRDRSLGARERAYGAPARRNHGLPARIDDRSVDCRGSRFRKRCARSRRATRSRSGPNRKTPRR